MNLSRRTTLALLGSGAVAIGGGVALVATLSDEELVRMVLERHLGRIVIEDDEISAFLSDFRDSQPWMFPPTKLAAFYGTAERLGVPAIARNALPQDRQQDLERFERHLLGRFHMTTDVAFRRSVSEQIRYLGYGPCQNPFAEFA